MPFSTSDRSAGLIFAAQPQVLARPVNVFFFKNCINSSSQNRKYLNNNNKPVDCFYKITITHVMTRNFWVFINPIILEIIHFMVVF